MDAEQKKRRDFMQNIAIVLLSLSAVFLFAQTQIFGLRDARGDPLRGFLSAASVPVPNGLQDSRELASPVQIAVTGDYGRYGRIGLSTSSEDFAPFRTLLGEALGSSSLFSRSKASEFQKALSSTSIYYDFLTPLPLAHLSYLMGGSAFESERFLAQKLIIYPVGDQVFLCFWDGADTYLQSETAVDLGSFLSIIQNYDSNETEFAMDHLSEHPEYQGLDPYSLLPAELPQIPVLSVSNSLLDQSPLLSDFGINPHTNNRYTESSGTEVIMEGTSFLRIYPNGEVLYQSGDTPTLKLPASDTIPTETEVVLWSGNFLSHLLDGASGQAQLYLQYFSQTEHTFTLRFGYHIDGTPIYASNGSPAAEIIFSGTSINSVRLYFRQYSCSSETSLLLPMRQTLAIAASHPGTELSVGYVDTGADAVSAVWLSN